MVVVINEVPISRKVSVDRPYTIYITAAKYWIKKKGSVNTS